MNKIKSRTLLLSLTAVILSSLVVTKIAVNPNFPNDRGSVGIVNLDLLERSPSNALKQSSDNLDELYRQAAAAQLYLSQSTKKIAEQFGGEASIPATLKGRERAREKIAVDYSGDASRITDLARSSIIFETEEQVLQALDILAQDKNVIRIKNRFKQPVNGYRDVLLNIRTPNGHIVEMQLHLRTILDAKYKFGDRIYREIRTIEANARKEQRNLTPNEIKQLESLRLEAEKLYNRAFKNSQLQLTR